jgi:hypothetical protein
MKFGIQNIMTKMVATMAICISSIILHAQIPLLNSYPGAKATIYLDFNGQLIEGTIWNQRGTIHADSANLSSNDIREIFNRIADDYHPFNINITTDSAVFEKAPVMQRTRIIFTPTSRWYGNAAGAACIGSFSWGDDTPGWVFTSLLGDNPKFIAACASHQIGHTLGLQHQSVYDSHCSKIADYNGGAGTLENGWAPIMGIGYYKNCTIWQTGPSAAGCDSLQSDIDIIAGNKNGFGFRADDYGDDYTKSEPVTIYNQHVSVRGVINKEDDKDAFSITIEQRVELQLNLVPDDVSKMENEPTIQVSLLNAKGEVITQYDPAKLKYIGIDKMLEAGQYYLIVNKNKQPRFNRPVFYALSGSLTTADQLKQFAQIR